MAALPRMRLAVGMVARTVPAATAAVPVVWVSVSPPAAVKAAVTPGARKRGCAEAETRQTARVQAIRPWTRVGLLHGNGNFVVEFQTCF